MPIPEGTEKKKSKVYVEKDAGYLQILPEIYCEDEIKADSPYPVSSFALALWKDRMEEITQPFSGATDSANGAPGLVPQSVPGDRNKFLRGDGQWVQIETSDNKVKSVANASKTYYVAGSELTSTNTGFQYFDPNVYVSEAAGELHARKFVGNLEGDVEGNLHGLAAYAAADEAGNNFVEHYATKADLNAVANASHTHPSSSISSMQGYSKGSSSAAIAATDTLNSAIGKLEVRIGKAAPLNSPALTGTPTSPTPTSSSGAKQIANKEYVDNAISSLIGDAGPALDTLGELADALNDNADFAASMTSALAGKLNISSAGYVKALSIADTTAGQNLTVQYGDNSTNVLAVKDTKYTPASQAPKAPAASAAVGTSVKYAREDHVHPLQTTISGNAQTATTAGKADRLTNARKLRANLGATEDATFDGSADQLNIPVTGVLKVANGGTGASNLNGLVQTGNVNQTIGGTKTFSNTITGSISGNAATATTASKTQGTPAGTTWVAGATAGKALVNSTATSFGAIANAPTKNYRVALGTYPSNSDLVYLYSVSNANVSSATNTVNKSLTWNAADGTLTAPAFSGTLNGSSTSCTGAAASATNDSDGNKISTSYLKLTGGTVSGTLNLTNVTDAQGTGTASPALRIGALTGAHLEFDGNEIMAKASGNTTGALYINNDGGQVIIGSGGLKVNGNITGTLKGNADSASKLGSATVGGTAKPIYLNAGSPAAISASVGNGYTPVYLNAGTIAACTSNIGGTSTPVYLKAGAVTACSSTVGSTSTPVYLNAGTVTACTNFHSPVYQGATSSAAGKAGLVPAAAAASYRNYLRADGTWTDVNFTETVAMSDNAINLSKGCIFTKTISANTTFTITGVPSGKATTFNLVLTNGGSRTITWPSSVKWTAGTPPSLTSSGIDVLTFLTTNGGSTWYGTVAVEGAA